jgi:hypothetical protein
MLTVLSGIDQKNPHLTFLSASDNITSLVYMSHLIVSYVIYFKNKTKYHFYSFFS